MLAGPKLLPPVLSQTGPSAERRQLTVMFADLVNSTVLSQSLDAEDLRDVMLSYHDAVAGAVRGGGGFVAKFMGDGVLAYFGYPKPARSLPKKRFAPGCAPSRPSRLCLVHQVSILSARIGIATGLVVVGDVVGEDIAREINVVGETPNLAARLLAPSQARQRCDRRGDASHRWRTVWAGGARSSSGEGHGRASHRVRGHSRTSRYQSV